MKNRTAGIIAAVVLLKALHINTYADQWLTPSPFDAFSQNGEVVAHVIPSNKRANPRLQVFSVKAGQRKPLWTIELSNPTSPVDVYVSDNGKQIITFDNWGEVGYGNDVVAIYSPSGLLKKYSLEELFGLPKTDDKFDEWKQFHNRFTHSVSSRWWRARSVGFFENDEPVFRLWIDWDSRWIAWDMLTGKTIKVSADQTRRWNQSYRAIVLQSIKRADADISEYEFLGKLKNPEDKGLIQQLLGDTNFSTGSITTSSNQGPTVFTFNSESSTRKAADRMLREWNQLNPDARVDDLYVFLGSLKLTVTFPAPPKKAEGNLIVYLVEYHDGLPFDPNCVPKHYLFAKLDHNYPYNLDKMSDSALEKAVNFSIKGITPGVYWVMAMWDRKKPFADEDPPFIPRKGDVITKHPVSGCFSER